MTAPFRNGPPRRLSGARLRARLFLAIPALVLSLLTPIAARAASAPPVPGNVTATVSGTTIHVTWSASSGATSYAVTNGNVVVTTTTTSFDWLNLSMGTYMCTSVAAKNSAGQSAWSAYACVTVKPPVPGNVVATPTSARNIHVTWNAVPNADEYQIGNGTDPVKVVFGTSYDWPVPIGGYMCFNVRAIRSSVASDWSPWACATAPAPQPTGVTVVALNPTTFNVSWQPVTYATSYTVSNGDSSTSGLTGTSFNWVSTPGKYMCFSVSAQFNSNSSAGTPWTCATTPTDNSSLHYVNMGDSLSAGEGTQTYTTGTNTSDNQCHRSDNSYSGQYVRSYSTRYHSVNNVACSGAISGEFYYADTPVNSMNVPDAGELAQDTALNSSTTLVTASYGINDIDFADILNTCYDGLFTSTSTIDACFVDWLTNKHFGSNKSETLSQAIDAEEPTLESLYRDIKSDAPNARIVAVTYPQIYPATGDANSNYYDCAIGPRGGQIITSQNQLNLIRSALNHLDDVIVTAAGNAGVTVLDERDAFQGHELCTANPYENTIIVTPNGAGNDSFHPNTAGYGRYAHDLEVYLGY